MSQSVRAIVPTLAVVDGVPTTTSVDVARHFSRDHKSVLRAVEILMAQLPEDARRNFAPSEYTDPTGRTLPAYRLTRDGFTLLAMGFTGKKALAFKLAYIDAFNRMEAQLRAPAQPANYPRITPAQYQQLAQAISGIVSGWFFREADRPHIWNHLRVAFHVADVRDLPAECFDSAIALVQGKEQAVRQAYDFIHDFRNWFNRECLSGGAPWTPAIARRLTQERGQRIQLPPRVDWLALADKSRTAKKEAA
jgi:Rha family phage regulatory protein